jgi:hypothetical protein
MTEQRDEPRVTRRTVLRFAGATVAAGGLAAAVPTAFGVDVPGALSLAFNPAAPRPAAGGAIGAGSLAGNIRKYDVYGDRVVSVDEVAGGLRMTRPVSLREMNRRLAAIPNEIKLGAVITTEAALGGRADLLLRSDGTYTSSGHMRATGFPSFAYQVTASVQGDGGAFLPTAFHQGRVLGTDTPGDRQRNWDESGRNENIRQHWLGIAENPRIDVRKEYNVSGVLGAAADVGVKIAEFVGLAAVANPSTAALLTLGSALDEAVDLPAPHKDWPLGVTIAAGAVVLFGPAAIAPAIAAGTVAELAVKTRTLRDDEWDFVRKVFGDTLPPRENIILTNLLGLEDRPFTMPTVGGRYLVNLGGGPFDSPTTWGGGKYPRPGQLLVHELTHTWQGRRLPAATYYCRGIRKIGGYPPGSDTGRAWGTYGLEQQATIVDSWYAALVPDPDRTEEPDLAKVAFYEREFLPARNPDYSKKPPHMFDRYVYGNVRAGLT